MSGNAGRRGRSLAAILILVVVWVGYGGARQSTLAQTASSIETPEIGRGQLDLDETRRAAWGLAEADWAEYQRLMTGPSGLWYAQLAPAVVLGINAKSEGERLRFARLVWEQERERLDALFAFNRTYQRVARAERSRPGFSFFEEALLGPSPLQSPVPSSARAAVPAARIAAFVGTACERCDRDVKTLVASGRALDIYLVDAESDREIRGWAHRVGIPLERVLSRSITLNHDAQNLLERTGHQDRELPLFFSSARLEAAVGLDALLRGAE